MDGFNEKANIGCFIMLYQYLMRLVIILILSGYAFNAQANDPLIQLAQIYEPTAQQQLRIFKDQYGRQIYMDEEGNIDHIIEPKHYPPNLAPPPPLDMNNQGPVDSGTLYDQDPPEDPNAAPYMPPQQRQTAPLAVRPHAPTINTPNFQTKNIPNEYSPAIEMPKARDNIVALQVVMARIGSSSGVIDGKAGSNFDKAAAAAGEISGKFINPNDLTAIEAALNATGGPAFTQYTITQSDVNQYYAASIPTDYALKAQMPAMAYTSLKEMLAERFHMDETYLQAINAGAHFNRAGEVIKVVNLKLPKREPIARIIADKARKQVRGYNSAGKLIVAYPSTIGSSDNPSPSGTVEVQRIVFNPNYTYNPNINFKQTGNNRILTIPPGPNGPVGTVWIALSKPTYGIHGTPDPSRIGKTSSHGCIRLTNFDATELAKLVKIGTIVQFID